MDEKKYTGINRILKSEFVQALLDKLSDGTFREFVDDWKWIFQFSKRYKWIVIFYTFLGIFASTVLVKQHVFIDILGGVAVAEAGLFLGRKLRAGRLFEKMEPKALRARENV